MRILVVSPHLPYPQIPHAGGVWLGAHLSRLTADHEVTVLVPATPEAREHLDDVPAAIDVRLTAFEEPRATLTTQWERVRRRIRFASLHTPALSGLREAGVRDLAAASDVVELHWIDTAILARELRGAGVTTPLSVVAHDVTAESIPARNHRLRPGWRRALAVVPTWIRRRTEVRDLNATDLVIVFKPQDQDLLTRLGVTTPSHVVEPFLELPVLDAETVRTPGSVLFTGALWRPENQDGVRWFLDEVWPAVRTAAPSATFTVAGASPPTWLVQHGADDASVVVTGTVPDLGPHYASASVFVAPLFVAGGLKFKVPQAMAEGLPVVASTLAAIGISDVAPADALWAVTDDATSMAGAIVDAIERPEDAAATGARAAAWARTHYSFDRSTHALVERYERLLAGS